MPTHHDEKQTYRSEVKVRKNLLSSAESIRAKLIVETHSNPLVDGEGFVSIHEPRNISQPVEVDGDCPVLKEETSKEQQRNDERGGHC